jgi:hypothetical protein
VPDFVFLLEKYADEKPVLENCGYMKRWDIRQNVDAGGWTFI